MADLSSLDFATPAEEGADLVLRHPEDNSVLTNSKGKEMTITLRGKDSPSYTQVFHNLSNQRLERSLRTKKGVTANAAQQMLNDDIELLAQNTTGWKNLEMGGKEYPFSLANARELYKKFAWIREQAHMFVDDRTNFLKS